MARPSTHQRIELLLGVGSFNGDTPQKRWQLALAMADDPSLFDALVSSDTSWVGVSNHTLKSCWQHLVSLRSELAAAFLDKLEAQRGAGLELIGGCALLNTDARNAWLDLLEERDPSDARVAMIYQDTLALLLREALVAKTVDTQALDTSVERLVGLLDRGPPDARRGALDQCLTHLIEAFDQTALDPDRMAWMARLLVEHGAELNQQWPVFYRALETPGSHEVHLTHPNRVHEVLWRGRRYGREDNPLAQILVALGGDWTAAWQCPDIGCVAQRVLRDCAVVRRERLGGAIEPRRRAGPGKNRM